MPTSSSVWAEGLAVFRKDLLSEYRMRASLSSVLLFGVTTLVIISYAIGPFGLLPAERPFLNAVLLWITLLFSAAAGLPRGFVKEEDAGTALALRLVGRPGAIYFGKWLGNLALVVLLETIVVPLFAVLMSLEVANWSLFVVTLLAGAAGLAGATTLLSAIVSRASAKGSLFAVLAFPILLPLLLGAIAATKSALQSPTFADGSDPVRLLISFGGAITVAGAMLFEPIWKD